MLRLKQIAVALFAFTTGCANESADAPNSAPATRVAATDANALVDSIVEEGVLPFLYVRLERADGSVIYERSAVNRALIPSFDIDGDSWMRIWSMSKLVTIVAALDLAEDGVIALSDPVSKYLPEVADMKIATGSDGAALTERPVDGRGNGLCPVTLSAPQQTMTIEHLLTHEAGFYYATTNVPCLDARVAGAELPNALDGDDFIRRVAAMPLIQDPGSVYYYGTNTSVLGVVLERATGMSLADLVRARIMRPLGIRGLAYRLPDGEALPPRFDGGDGALRRAHDGELSIFGGATPSYGPDQNLFLGGEGMVGTAKGYAKFIRMVLRRGALDGVRILEERTIEELVKPRSQLDSPFGYDGYNLWISNGYRGEGKPRGPAGIWVG
ncbi:MAG: serine hydrolase, partial [Pseudomonadota bacterium]